MHTEVVLGGGGRAGNGATASSMQSRMEGRQGHPGEGAQRGWIKRCQTHGGFKDDEN